jgi:RNA polymerase sigma factor (sigma-70 family)
MVVTSSDGQHGEWLVRRTAMPTQPTDEDLLTSVDPKAFGLFYARHLRDVERYFARRVSSRETAADLTAETFVAALVARRRFVPGVTPAAGWLYTIAARRFIDFQRRAIVEQRARETLESEARVTERWTPPPTFHATEDLRSGLLRHLPADQRHAVVAHVLDASSYSDIASIAGASPASIRQRVSRGLRTLRAPLLIYRGAQELARQDRAYRYGGGHGAFLTAVAPRAPLDCSAATSLILNWAGALDSDVAWTSGRLAREWGDVGEGRHVTLWANDHHVWLEFKLDDDHGERFDPTPSHLAPNAGCLTSRAGPTRDFTPRHLPGL